MLVTAVLVTAVLVALVVEVAGSGVGTPAATVAGGSALGLPPLSGGSGR